MVKNDAKLNMLFMFLAFMVTACSVNKSTVQRKSPNSKNRSHLRKDIEYYAKKQIGVKYKYGGKNPKGFDCSGFTQYVFDKFAIAVAPSSKLQAKQGKTVNIKWAKKGDLLFFGRGGKVSHVALIIENNRDGITVVHSTSSRGVIMENVTKSTYWKKRIMFARNILER